MSEVDPCFDPVCWWRICAGGPFALPVDVAAKWHDAGSFTVFLGEFKDAEKLCGECAIATPAPPAEPAPQQEEQTKPGQMNLFTKSEAA